MITMLTTNISKFFSFISTSIGRGFNINDYIVAEILIIFKFAYLQAVNSSLVLKVWHLKPNLGQKCTRDTYK